MKDYHECERIHNLGSSDRALLNIELNDGTSRSLHFGEDGDYSSYIVKNDEAIIPNYYKKVLTADKKITVYDDFEKCAVIKAPKIEIYRSGNFGCLIHLVGSEPFVINTNSSELNPDKVELYAELDKFNEETKIHSQVSKEANKIQKEILYESDMETISKEMLEANPPIGRINYLGFNGEVVEKVEYLNIQTLEEDVQNESFYGVPLTVTLYKDLNGKCCPHRINPLSIVDNPYLPPRDFPQSKGDHESKQHKLHKHHIDRECKENMFPNNNKPKKNRDFTR